MVNVIAEAIKRQRDFPEIHRKLPKLRTGESYGTLAQDMVLDLKTNIPQLSVSQLSMLVGVSRMAVSRALANGETQAEWSTDNNESSAAAELLALQTAHPGRRYEDDAAAAQESDVPVHFTAPPLSDPHRRADQSHTLPRPITLPTAPFRVAA